MDEDEPPMRLLADGRLLTVIHLIAGRGRVCLSNSAETWYSYENLW